MRLNFYVIKYFNVIKLSSAKKDKIAYCTVKIIYSQVMRVLTYLTN